MNYLVASGMFAALGLSAHAIYRWWHSHLQRLAQAHNIETRRRLATRHFAGVALLSAGAFVATVFSVLQFASVSKLFLLVGFAVAAVPNIVWWHRHWMSLKALGYGLEAARPNADVESSTRVSRVFWVGGGAVAAVELPILGYVFGVVGMRRASLTLLIGSAIVCYLAVAAWIFLVRRAARQQ